MVERTSLREEMPALASQLTSVTKHVTSSSLTDVSVHILSCTLVRTGLTSRGHWEQGKQKKLRAKSMCSEAVLPDCEP